MRKKITQKNKRKKEPAATQVVFSREKRKKDNFKDVVSCIVMSAAVLGILLQVPQFDAWMEKTIYASDDHFPAEEAQPDTQDAEGAQSDTQATWEGETEENAALNLWTAEIQEDTESEMDQKNTVSDSKERQKDTTTDTKERQDSTEASDPDKQNEGFDPLILVNAWNFLPEDYEVQPIELEQEYYQSVDIHCYKQAKKMLEDCRAAGNRPTVCSSYRSHKRQKELFAEEVEKYLAKGYSRGEAKAKASNAVAIPGTSEHELGLALDIVDKGYQLLDKGQENTPTQKWLMEHSYEYGFVLRYPTNKIEMTGIIYEPWHYRYVGLKAAKEMYEQGICLEEYLKVYQ